MNMILHLLIIYKQCEKKDVEYDIVFVDYLQGIRQERY